MNIDINSILLLVIVIEIGLVYFKIAQVVEEQPGKLGGVLKKTLAE